MKFFIALFLFSVSHFAVSQDQIVTIDAFDYAYTGGFLIRSDKGDGPDRDETTFRFNLNYAQSLEQYVGLMWRARAFINRTDVNYRSFDSLESTWGAAGGFLYNFQSDDVKNSIFVSGLVGVERATYEIGNLDDRSGWNLLADIEGGKRWDLGNYSVANIAYAPSVSITFKRYGGDIRDDYYRSGNAIKFNFLKFDVLF